MEVMPEPTLINEKLLRKAWELFDIYDRTAIATQKRFLNFRIAILVVGVISTILVVIKAVWDKYHVGLIGANNADNQIVTILENGFYGLVIIAPIAVSVLLAASVKLDRGMNWVLLRASAEILKKQIYQYRVGFYDPMDADKFLAKEIQVVSDRLMKTQVNRSGLVIDIHKSKSDNLLSLLFELLIRKILNPIQKSIKETLKRLREKLDGKSEKPQTYVREDLFSPLTVEQYLEYRLIDQLSWYRRKTLKLDSQWQFLQWSIYVWGGLGTFLAAIKAEIWIAITNAIATAIASFLDFKQLDSTLMCYNQAACNLENLLCWWHALTDEARANPDNIKKLVENTEKVIQSETSSWVEEMREALSELYKENENKNGEDK
jgi:hypothetical protein